MGTPRVGPARAFVRVLPAALLVSQLGCMGLSDSLSNDAASSGAVDPGSSGESLSCETTSDPGPSPVRRLTRREYVSTLRDLLQTDAHIGMDFTADPVTRGFDNNALVQTVSEVQAEEYLTAAEAAAAQANLRALAPCSGTTPDDACARAFIRDFGQKAYRRPLEPAEAERLLAVFQAGAQEGGSFDEGLRYVLQVALQSPAFLYRAELDPPQGPLAPVTGHAMASRLSYFFWGTMPDDELFRAASSGELSTPEGIRAQAERLLAAPRAKQMVASFHEQWLDLGELDSVQKNADRFPSWPLLRPLLRKETELFVEHAFWEGRSARALLNGSYTFADGTLAQHYGLPPPQQEGFSRMELGHGRRGLLTQGALLARTAHSADTSPVLRGKLVRQVLLCQDLPSPPPGVSATVPEVGPGATTRERYAAHQADPSCSGCHQLMDPVGLGLEHFDAVGAWRDTEASKPIDASGELLAAGDVSGPFNGATELAEKLAASETWSDCIVRQWFRFTFGRLEGERDACTLEAVKERFAQTGGDLVDLLLTLAQSDAFLYRAGAAEESP